MSTEHRQGKEQIMSKAATLLLVSGALFLSTLRTASPTSAETGPIGPNHFPDGTPTPPPALFDPNRIIDFSNMGTQRFEISADAAVVATPVETPQPTFTTRTEQLQIVQPAIEPTVKTSAAEQPESKEEERKRKEQNRGNTKNRTGDDNDKNNQGPNSATSANNAPTQIPTPERCAPELCYTTPIPRRTPTPTQIPTPERCAPELCYTTPIPRRTPTR